MAGRDTRCSHLRRERQPRRFYWSADEKHTGASRIILGLDSHRRAAVEARTNPHAELIAELEAQKKNRTK